MTGDSAVYKIGAQPMGQLAKVLDGQSRETVQSGRSESVGRVKVFGT